MPIDSGFTLRPRHWFAWQEAPLNLDLLFAGTPVFVTAVEPQRAGNGDLRIAFISALHVETALKRTIAFRVMTREKSYLVGEFVSVGGEKRVGMLSPVDFQWIERFCEPYAKRFPKEDMLPYEKLPTAQQYLSRAFGESAEAILSGATPNWYQGELPPLPEQRARISIDVQYSLFDSYLLRRGFLPQDMSDKWFAYFERDQLHLRRSWTGDLIYEVHFESLGEALFASYAYANRNPEQYQCEDDDEDRETLLRLVDDLILRNRYGEQ